MLHGVVVGTVMAPPLGVGCHILALVETFYACLWEQSDLIMTLSGQLHLAGGIKASVIIEYLGHPIS